MALPCAGTHGGRLISSVLGLSYCMARTMTRTIPGHGRVLLQMRFQAHCQYLMLIIHGFVAHSQDRKLMWLCRGPRLFPAMLLMTGMIPVPVLE